MDFMSAGSGTPINIAIVELGAAAVVGGPLLVKGNPRKLFTSPRSR